MLQIYNNIWTNLKVSGFSLLTMYSQTVNLCNMFCVKWVSGSMFFMYFAKLWWEKNNSLSQAHLSQALVTWFALFQCKHLQLLFPLFPTHPTPTRNTPLNSKFSLQRFLFRFMPFEAKGGCHEMHEHDITRRNYFEVTCLHIALASAHCLGGSWQGWVVNPVQCGGRGAVVVKRWNTRTRSCPPCILCVFRLGVVGKVAGGEGGGCQRSVE